MAPTERKLPQGRAIVPGDSSGSISRTTARAISSFWAVLTIVFGVAYLFEPQASYAMFGAAISLVVSIPLLLQNYRALSPFTPFVLVVYFSYGWRGLTVSLAWEDEGGSHDSLYLLGQGPEYFFFPSAMSLIAYLVLVAFYILLVSRITPNESLAPAWRYSFSPLSKFVIPAFAVIGFIAFVLYVQRVGGFSVDALSAKRSTITGLDLDSGYQSHNDLRFIAEFSSVALWLYCAKLGLVSRVRGLTAIELTAIVLLVANALMLPFYSSTRGPVFIILAIAIIIYSFISLRRLNLAFVSVIVILSVLFFGAMTAFRTADQVGDEADTSLSALVENSASEITSNRNFGGMFVFEHVANNVPDKIPYQNGSTLIGWGLAFVPRSLWESKPLISSGPLIGILIYGTERSGIPPGLLGDGFLNYGYAGMFLSAIFAAVFLALAERLLRRADLDVGFALLYFSAPFLVGYYLLNQGVGFAVFCLLTGVLPMLLGVALSGSWQKSANERSS